MFHICPTKRKVFWRMERSDMLGGNEQKINLSIE